MTAPLARLIDRLGDEWLAGRKIHVTPAEQQQLERADRLGALGETIRRLASRDAALREAHRWLGIAAELDERATTIKPSEVPRVRRAA